MSKEKHTLKLTDKQKQFCEEYLIDINATQSAIRAGYSEKTARITASENLAKPNIQEYLSLLQAKRAEKVGITQEEVLKNLRLAQEIALGEKPHKTIVKESLGNGMTQHREEELHKTDLNNYVKINEMYMKHLGMFTEKVEHSGSIDINGLADRLIGK